MDIRINGSTRTLSQKDFKASGGEGRVFVQGSTAFKIYTDPSKMIPMGKIDELSCITDPNIIRPQDVITDMASKPIGYTLRYVENAYALCQLFPKAFRLRNAINPQDITALAPKLRDRVDHVHERGILFVDFNEMNILLSSNFKDIYFIDVDSYQTPRYPATAIMDSIRDRHGVPGVFNEGTDWFSFAIVSFQMFVGIHPYKGKYLGANDLDSRMSSNISVLSKGVSVPAACLPFDVIPSSYRKWYEDVFNFGERCAPPKSLDAVKAIAVGFRVARSSGTLVITELLSLSDDVTGMFGNVVASKSEFVSFSGNRFPAKPQGSCFFMTSKSEEIYTAYREDNGSLRIRSLSGYDIDGSVLYSEGLMSYKGNLYSKLGNKVYRLVVNDTTGDKFTSFIETHYAGNVTENSTIFFDGVAMVNMLGSQNAVVFPESGLCYTLRLSELDSHRIVDARFDSGVLVVIAEKSGKYDRFVYRFDTENYSDYSVRITGDVGPSTANFAVLDTGVAALMTSDDKIELFSRNFRSSSIKVLEDSAVDSSAALFARAGTLVAAIGNRIYKISMS